MADLSNINQRRNAQDRITSNRDAILPTRRETRVDGVRVAADMRSAQRGQSQAEEIRRLFGMAQNTANAYFDYDIKKTAEEAEEDYTQGQVDAAAGREIDPANAQAYAYTRGFNQVKAANLQTTFERETAQQADTMLNQGANPEEIQAFYDERTREFIGATADSYEEDEVRLTVIDRLTRWSSAEDNRIDIALKAKTDGEFLENTALELQARMDRGEAIDPIAEIDALTSYGLDRDRSRDAVLKAIGSYALTTGDLSGIDAAEDAREFDPNAPVTVETAEIEGSELDPVAPPAPPAPPPAPARETFRAPVEGGVSSGYGQRRAPIAGASTNHQALDIAVPVGTPVGAPASGVVERAGPSGGNGGTELVIRHADGSKTGFSHLSGVEVEAGDTVTQGQIVAKSGNTGNSTGPHLHWTYRDASGRRQNPQSMVGKELAGTSAPQAPDAGSAGADAPAAPQEPAYRERRAGRSIWTPEQQIYLAGVREQVASESERRVEKVRQDKRDALALDLYDASVNGTNVDDRITTAMRDGTLTASEAMSYRSAFSSLRNDQLEGEADDDLVLDYAERFATERPNWNTISSQADRDYQAGRFGTGRAATRAWLEVKQRAANGSRGDNAIPPEQRAATGHARSYLSSALGNLGGGEALTTPARRVAADALTEYERRIQAGESPMVVADSIVSTYTPRINAAQGGRQGGGNGGGNTRQPGQTQTTGPQELTYRPGQGVAPTGD